MHILCRNRMYKSADCHNTNSAHISQSGPIGTRLYRPRFRLPCRACFLSLMTYLSYNQTLLVFLLASLISNTDSATLASAFHTTDYRKRTQKSRCKKQNYGAKSEKPIPPSPSHERRATGHEIPLRSRSSASTERIAKKGLRVHTSQPFGQQIIRISTQASY